MIKGMHALFYSPEPEKMRAFFRDVLGFPSTDTGGGWLIFDAPEADFGVHPGDDTHQEVSFYCDDLRATMAALKAKGVEFTRDIEEQEWGYVTFFRLPGGGEFQLYQAKYAKE